MDLLLAVWIVTLLILCALLVLRIRELILQNEALEDVLYAVEAENAELLTKIG